MIIIIAIIKLLLLLLAVAVAVLHKQKWVETWCNCFGLGYLKFHKNHNWNQCVFLCLPLPQQWRSDYQDNRSKSKQNILHQQSTLFNRGVIDSVTLTICGVYVNKR